MKKFYSAATGVILMWTPSDIPVEFYTVEVRQEAAVIKTIYSTNNFLILDDLLTDVPDGAYHITMTGGTVNYTNWITLPFPEQTNSPTLQRPEGFYISAQ